MKNDTVTINTLVSASVEEVWKAWTHPLHISKWFGSDPDGKVLSAQLDVRTGGIFEISFQDADQTRHTCFGVYTEVQEQSKLAFSWAWQSEPGVESFVTVTLAPENRFTRMHFEHNRIGTASIHNYLQGWQATFAKLELLFTNNPGSIILQTNFPDR